MRAWIVVVAILSGVLLPACSGPPTTTDDPFEWTVALSNLDNALLATCSDSSQLYVVGGRSDRGRVMHWDGTSWVVDHLPATTQELWWCWIDPMGTVWAVGENASIVHNRSGDWAVMDATNAVDASTTLYGVWGRSATDIYVVGGKLGPDAGATIARYDGIAWTSVDVSALPQQILFKIWGSDTDVWAVGAGGTIAHAGANAAWTVQTTPITDRLIAVWGTDNDEVFAVGGDGRGVVLRYAAGTWNEFATTPEALSGVWTAPGKPLYVGGNRGYLGRFRRDNSGIVDSTAPDVTVPVNDLCVHSMTNFGNAIVAAGADLFGGNNESWRGGLLAHNILLAGVVDDTDASVVDAGGSDAGLADALVADALVADALMADAGPPDASLPGPGEPCGPAPNFCAQGLSCWQLFTSGELVCTQDCTDSSECETDYGIGACCARPGPQTVNTVCIAASANECMIAGD